jgi:hypothetical protein
VTITVAPSTTALAPIEFGVTPQAPRPDQEDGNFVTPQLFIVLIAALAILGSGFLYLGRRS